MDLIEILQMNKDRYIRLIEDDIRKDYPDRTDEFYKCVRDMKFVIDAYCIDLQNHSTNEIEYMLAQFYKGKRLQLKSKTVELFAHRRLIDMIFADATDVSTEQRKEFFVLSDMFITALEYDDMSIAFNDFDNLSLNRISFSRFNTRELTSGQQAKILNSADGITPSLAHNYHYRVDVLPNESKRRIWPYAHSFYPEATTETRLSFFSNFHNKSLDEWQNEGVCINWQMQAPFILMYSIPRKKDRTIEWDRNLFPTGRDTTLIGLGLNLWNVMMTVESMGLNSCLCRAFEEEYIDKLVGIQQDDDMGDYHWVPYVFLCVGYGDIPKGDHRDYKPIGIVNTLKIR